MDKILYISYDGLTDILGKSQILPYIVGLTKYGYAFTIISFEKRHRKERLESDINNIIKGLPIDWVPLTYHRNPPILSSIFDDSDYQVSDGFDNSVQISPKIKEWGYKYFPKMYMNRGYPNGISY